VRTALVVYGRQSREGNGRAQREAAEIYITSGVAADRQL